MQIRPTEQSAGNVYYTLIASILPRPIAWVASRSPEGQRNLAPFSFFSGVTARPASLMFSVVRGDDGRLKDTARNVLATEQFVVNIVPHALTAAMSRTSSHQPPEVDEFALAELESVPAEQVAADRVVGSPVQFECRLMQAVPIQDGDEVTAHLFIGRIELIHVADDILDARGRIDPVKLDAVGRMGGGQYCTTRDLFAIKRP
jgi:flavin reductase (DIM6/NTAB) family NADH-FMN oxidoreductase RutF